MTQVQAQTQRQAGIASNGKGNNDNRRFKFINFFIHNISSYFKQITNDKTDKEDNKTKLTMLTAITIATPDVLNLLVFLSIIDQVILSNLQLQ